MTTDTIINTDTAATTKAVYTAGTYSGSWLAAKISVNDLAQALDATMKDNPKSSALALAGASAGVTLLIESLL